VVGASVGAFEAEPAEEEEEEDALTAWLYDILISCCSWKWGKCKRLKCDL